MAFSLSTDRIDETGKELLAYGTEEFPIAFFDDDLTIVSVPYHWHDELEIVVVTEGGVRVRIAGNEFALSAGEGYFANSAVLHGAKLTTLSGRQHALVFSPKIISPAEDLIWRSYVLPVLENRCLPFLRLRPAVPWQREILQLAEKAWSSGGYETEGYPLAVRACLSEALSLIAAHMRDPESAFCCTSGFERDEERIKKALVYIEKNYDGPVSIDDVAKSANISTSTCLRLFSTVLNTTPIAFVVKYRVRRAAEELRRADGRTISEIAYSCGFSDASYFNRCFRKEYGVTPSEYGAGRRKG